MCQLCMRIIMAGHTVAATADAPPVFTGIDLSISAEQREKMPRFRAAARAVDTGDAANGKPDIVPPERAPDLSPPSVETR